MITDDGAVVDGGLQAVVRGRFFVVSAVVVDKMTEALSDHAADDLSVAALASFLATLVGDGLRSMGYRREVVERAMKAGAALGRQTVNFARDDRGAIMLRTWDEPIEQLTPEEEAHDERRLRVLADVIMGMPSGPTPAPEAS